MLVVAIVRNSFLMLCALDLLGIQVLVLFDIVIEFHILPLFSAFDLLGVQVLVRVNVVVEYQPFLVNEEA